MSNVYLLVITCPKPERKSVNPRDIPFTAFRPFSEPVDGKRVGLLAFLSLLKSDVVTHEAQTAGRLRMSLTKLASVLIPNLVI